MKGEIRVLFREDLVKGEATSIPTDWQPNSSSNSIVSYSFFSLIRSLPNNLQVYAPSFRTLFSRPLPLTKFLPTSSVVWWNLIFTEIQFYRDLVFSFSYCFSYSCATLLYHLLCLISLCILLRWFFSSVELGHSSRLINVIGRFTNLSKFSLL